MSFNKIGVIKKTFNSYNHKIQFTIEKELEGKIVFLDVLVIRNGDVMKTNWHQQPTCSDRYLNFHSHHPYNYKINVINNLIDKGITLSRKDFHKENIEKIRSILQKNNYPPNIINPCIKKRLNHLILQV